MKLTARVQHPNVAQIYDRGLRRGVYCYAMELIDGVKFDEYVKEHGFTQQTTTQNVRA